jgi:hypothetical protein
VSICIPGAVSLAEVKNEYSLPSLHLSTDDACTVRWNNCLFVQNIFTYLCIILLNECECEVSPFLYITDWNLVALYFLLCIT